MLKTLSYNRKPNFCINTESIFIEIFLPKSKPVLIGISYRPPDKYNSVNCLERAFSDTNAFESQECYLLGDNTNLQPKDKEIFRHKPANIINKEIPHLIRSYLEFCFTHSRPPGSLIKLRPLLTIYLRTHQTKSVNQAS